MGLAALLATTLLAGCHPTPTVGESADHSAKWGRAHQERARGGLLFMETWSKPAAWRRMLTDAGDPLLVDGAKGDVRILRAYPGDGYEIVKATLDCARGTVHLGDTRASERDARQINLTVPKLAQGFGVPVSQVHAVCAGSPTVATGAPMQVLGVLRAMRPDAKAVAGAHAAAAPPDPTAFGAMMRDSHGGPVVVRNGAVLPR